ncbi:hypothetical protein VULLAG_LOCUS12873 [Vulpes lagopus]
MRDTERQKHRQREKEIERQRHRQREKQAPCQEPDVGLDPGILGSRPEPMLKPPRSPRQVDLIQNQAASLCPLKPSFFSVQLLKCLLTVHLGCTEHIYYLAVIFPNVP